MTADTLHGLPLRDDVVAAVRATFNGAEADIVLSDLSRLDEDRLIVAVLVLATVTEPDPGKVRKLVDLALEDYRDVLTVEYEPQRVDYKAALSRLRLSRP